MLSLIVGSGSFSVSARFAWGIACSPDDLSRIIKTLAVRQKIFKEKLPDPSFKATGISKLKLKSAKSKE